ncbi:MAG: hypothetical protein LBQ41_01985 [Candidatus Ancillula sp.]|jgi:secretion/DNA translocation related TadE-like protein|nr:hypothetical protein [Candidatus Ancillula sp.]
MLKDEGSGTLLGVALVLCAVGVMFACSFVATYFQVAEQVQGVANFSALAAADEGQFGINGCQTAGEVAAKNKASLEECRILENSDVEVRVRSTEKSLVAKTARAGVSLDGCLVPKMGVENEGGESEDEA